MGHIVVASENPVKVAAVLAGFRAIFPGRPFETTSIAVPSGVGRQPASDAETLRGAHQRAANARRGVPNADYWVGIEGGIDEIDDGMAAFAWVVVQSRNRVGKGRTGTFFLPEAVATRVRRGEELGVADDAVFGRVDSKRENGAVGLLTGDVIDRTALYKHAVILALVPFRNESLFSEGRPRARQVFVQYPNSGS